MRIFLLLVVLHCCSGMADASATPGTSDATSSAAFEASAEGASIDTEVDIKDIIPSRPHKAVAVVCMQWVLIVSTIHMQAAAI